MKKTLFLSPKNLKSGHRLVTTKALISWAPPWSGRRLCSSHHDLSSSHYLYGPEAPRLIDSPVHRVLEAEVQNHVIQAIPDVLW